MRKLVLLCLLALLMLGIAAPALATPVDDLAALARYFPSESPLFFAIRTDDAYITELEGVLALIAAKLPPDSIPPEFSLRETLDRVLAEIGTDFETGVRPWLGGTAAFGLTSTDTPRFSPPFLLAASIADRAEAEAFWKSLLELTNATYGETTGETFTYYMMDPEAPERGGLLISDDVLLLGELDLRSLLLTREAHLAQNANFTGVLALLPAAAYNAVLYLDTPQIAAQSFNSMGQSLNGVDTATMTELFGAQAIGLTVLNDRSLVIDGVVMDSSAAALDMLGMSPDVLQLQPVDLSFAAHIPADASLVTHAANLWGMYEVALDAARAAAALEPRGASPEDIDAGLRQMRMMFRGMFGLQLEEDVLSWMTGDFAAFASVDSVTIRQMIEQGLAGEAPVFDGLPIEFGLVIEATDPAKARKVADGLGETLTRLVDSEPDASVSQEQVGGVEVTVLSITIDTLPNQEIVLDVLIGANDDVFVIATRDAATAILTGAPGLDTAAGFAEAAAYLLPNPTSVWYMDSSGFSGLGATVSLGMVGPMIGNVFDEIIANLEDGSITTPSPEETLRRQQMLERQREEELRRIRAMLDFLDNLMTSATISTDHVEGASRFRAVLTLAE